MTDRKPREFWITNIFDGTQEAYGSKDEAADYGWSEADLIHTIEHSAFADLLECAEALVDQCSAHLISLCKSDTSPSESYLKLSDAIDIFRAKYPKRGE